MQLGLYLGLLRAPLESRDAELTRRAFMRWIVVDIGWQAFVLLACWAYVAAKAGSHSAGIAWIAPGLGAILGTALPLQLVVAVALRAARR